MAAYRPVALHIYMQIVDADASTSVALKSDGADTKHTTCRLFYPCPVQGHPCLIGGLLGPLSRIAPQHYF